jgi:hypothetical protein
MTNLAFSPDGHFLATGCVDGIARLWDLTRADSAAGPVEFGGHNHSIDALAFSADGRRLATGSMDKDVRLWDLTSASPGSEPLVLRRADPALQSWGLSFYGKENCFPFPSLAFSPDGRWLAAINSDDTGSLMLTSKPIASENSHQGASFPSGTTQLWNLRVDELINTGLRAAGRDLTPEERRHYQIVGPPLSYVSHGPNLTYEELFQALANNETSPIGIDVARRLHDEFNLDRRFHIDWQVSSFIIQLRDPIEARRLYTIIILGRGGNAYIGFLQGQLADAGLPAKFGNQFARDTASLLGRSIHPSRMDCWDQPAALDDIAKAYPSLKKCIERFAQDVYEFRMTQKDTN